MKTPLERNALPAQQVRSQKTQDRLLEAAEALIEEQGFGRITMKDIAKRANRAVGSLYSRLGSKDQLKLCLIGRYLASLERRVQAFVSDPCWHEVGLRQRVRAVVALYVDHYSTRRGLVGMINLHPMPPAVEERLRPRLLIIYESTVRFLSESPGAELVDLVQRAEFGLLMVFATVRSRVVEGADSGIAKDVDTEALESELSWLLWLYLSTERDETTS